MKVAGNAADTTAPSAGGEAVDARIARLHADDAAALEADAGIEPRSELAAARAFKRLRGDRVAFTEPRTWIVWDGRRWAMSDALALDAVTEVAREATGQAAWLTAQAEAAPRGEREARSEDAAAQRTYARKLATARALRAVLDLARPLLAVDASAFDPPDADHLLACANGTVDLRTGEIGPHDPAHRITRMVPHAYDPAALAPRWDRFVSEVLGARAPEIAFLRRWCGYCLTGSTAEQKILFLIGGGNNGKSVLLTTLRAVLGPELGVVAPPRLLLATDLERHPAQLARLRGVRLATISEVKKGGRLDEEMLKGLTGSDAVSARAMRENFSDFRPTGKLMFGLNDLPRVSDYSRGFWRRVLVLEFGEDFTGREDRELDRTLQAELPGILRWCVDGAIEWHRAALTPPASVAAAAEAWRGREDLVGGWLTERAPRGAASSGQLRGELNGWLEAQGERGVTARRLAAELERLKWTQERTSRSRLWLPPAGGQASAPCLLTGAASTAAEALSADDYDDLVSSDFSG